MATYPIFSQEGGQRIAINPNSVTSIVEIEPKRVPACLPDGGSANITMFTPSGMTAAWDSGPFNRWALTLHVSIHD